MTKLHEPTTVRPLDPKNKSYESYFDQPYARSYAAGWWTNLETGEEHVLDTESIQQKEVLIMTELAEAVEGDRKDLMDDKLPHRKMIEVELADVVIRALDLSYAMGITLETLNDDINTYKSLMHNVSFTSLTHSSCGMIFNGGSNNYKYLLMVRRILIWGEQNGYDIHGALIEKMEYNANRADHKVENRKAEGGKSY